MEYTFDEIVIHARTGLNPRKNFILGKGNNRYITIKNIKNNSLVIDDNTDFIDDEAVDMIHKRSQIKKGDILFASIGRFGDTYIIEEEPTGWDINESVFAFTVDEKLIRQKYFHYLFKHKETIRQLTKNSSGSTFKSIKMNQLKKMRFDLPDLNSQDIIVSLLDCVTNIISIYEQELLLLDELVKARFVEMFGDPITNDMLWNTVKLNDVCYGIGDGLHGTPEYDEYGDYPFINGNNLKNGKIEITPSTKMVNEDIYRKYFIKLTENTILLSINGTLGNLALYNGEKVVLGKSACYCNLIPDINRIFVCSVMKTDAFSNFLESNATSSTIKNIGLKVIREFELIVPPLELQNQFASFVEEVDKSRLLSNHSLFLIKSLIF